MRQQPRPALHFKQTKKWFQQPLHQHHTHTHTCVCIKWMRRVRWWCLLVVTRHFPYLLFKPATLSLSLAGWPSFFGVSRFYFYFVMLPPVRDIHWNRDACASSSSLGIFALLWRIHFQPQPFTWCCNQMILERARENPCVWQARREEERKEKTSEKHSPFARYHRLLYTEHVHPICRSRSLSLLRPSSEFDFALLCCVCVCVCAWRPFKIYLKAFLSLTHREFRSVHRERNQHRAPRNDGENSSANAAAAAVANGQEKQMHIGWIE